MSTSCYFFLDQGRSVELQDTLDGACMATITTPYYVDGSIDKVKESYFFNSAEEAFDFFKANEKELYVPQNLTEDIPF
jgi:hypothetical protein